MKRKLFLLCAVLLTVTAAFADSETSAAARCRALLSEGDELASQVNTNSAGVARWESAYAICQQPGMPLDLVAHSAARWLPVFARRSSVAADKAYREVITRLRMGGDAAAAPLSEVLFQYMSFLDGQGRPDDAVAMGNEYVLLSQKAFGAQSPQVADGFVSIGYLYEHQNDRAAAESYFRRAIVVAKASCDRCDSLKGAYIALFNLLKTQKGREAEAEGVLDTLEALP